MRSGDPIELRSRKPCFTSEKNLDFLGPGDIIIRATQGIEPVIEYEMTIKNPKPLLALGSGVQLKLCGITIVVHYPEGNTPAWPPVIKAAGVAKIDRCAFKVAATSHIKGSVALFSDGGALEVDRCWFEGFDKAIELSASNKTPRGSGRR